MQDSAILKQKPYQIQKDNDIYFVTFATVEWVDVFTRVVYRDIVADSLRYCQQEKGLELYAWCIMSNHVHLIASSNLPTQTLSDILRDFKKYTSKKIIEAIQTEPESRRDWMLWLFKSAGEDNKRNKTYQFWRQDNHAELLYGYEFSKQKLAYLHQNPVTAQIVENAEDYLYSSARNYAGRRGLLEITYLF
jgi:putative transposase